MAPPKKNHPLIRLIAALFNPWLWDLLLKRVLYFLFPFLDHSIKLHSPPHDAELVGLDGVTKYSLVHDFVKKMPTGVPIVINFGSYN